MLTLSLNQFNFIQNPPQQKPTIEPSDLSVLLWLNAFNLLCQNQLMEFLKALDALRQEILIQLVTAKKSISPDNIAGYYGSIQDGFILTRDTLHTYLSMPQYNKYLDIVRYFIEETQGTSLAMLSLDTKSEQFNSALKLNLFNNCVSYFLPYTKRLNQTNKKTPSRTVKKVDYFINHESEIVATDPLTPKVLNTVLTDLQQIATRLHTQYQACFFKRFYPMLFAKWQGILTLITRIEKLTHDFEKFSKKETEQPEETKKEDPPTTPSSLVINVELKAAENSFLGQHRRWLSRKLSFFTGHKPLTRCELERIRRRLYESEITRIRQHMFKA